MLDVYREALEISKVSTPNTPGASAEEDDTEETAQTIFDTIKPSSMFGKSTDPEDIAREQQLK